MISIIHQNHPRLLKQPNLADANARTGYLNCCLFKSLSAPHSTRAAGARAFTLLEVILAVTIAGALLAAAASLMVSISSVWMERQDRHFFEDHVDGVAEFLQASFSTAGTMITVEQTKKETANDLNASAEVSHTATAGNGTLKITAPGRSESGDRNKHVNPSGNAGLISTAQAPIDWSKPPGYADYQDPLLHFGLKKTPPLLIQTDDAPIIGVEAYLHFDEDKGLSLLWHSTLQEGAEDLNDLRRTLISDLITEIEYIYWNERFEKWETENEPKEGDADEPFVLPRFLKLTFEYQGETKKRTLTIPLPSLSALLF